MGVSDATALVLGVFIFSYDMGILSSIYLNKSPLYLHDGSFIYSDGYQLKRLLQETTFPDEYFKAVKKHHEKKYGEAAAELKIVLNNGFKKGNILPVM
ncbi:MAG: hypothetical protein R2788_16785 [Saprospiraceae bacterium]